MSLFDNIYSQQYLYITTSSILNNIYNGKHYSQVPVLANKKLFASTPCLVHYPRGQGNKMANWKSCIGCWERFGVYISLGGVLTNTHFAIFAIIVLSTKKLLAYLLVMIVIRSNCYPVQNLSVRSRGVQSSHLR